ncbi:MAG: TAXI family TRAP transporter solute-binding subunit [Xanthobacteraceae bacterium]
MKSMRFVAVAPVAAGCLMLGALAAPANAEMVGIGTTKSTAVAQMTAAISKVVSEHSGLQMRTQAMGGTQQYIPVVNDGQLDFGVGNMFQTYQAFAGLGLSAGHKYDNLRLVATLMPFSTGLVTPVKGNVRKVADLKGKRIPYGFKAAPLFQTFMEGFLADGGLTMADIEQVPCVGLRQSWEMLMQGKVDAVISAAGSAGNKEMDTKIDGGVRYVDFDPSGPGAKKTLEMLPKTYFVELNPSPQTPVVKEKIHIIGYDFMLWAYKGVPDEVVMKVVKALYDHADEVKASSAIWREWNPKQIAKDQGPGMEYHPGAIAFYKTAGVWKH